MPAVASGTSRDIQFLSVHPLEEKLGSTLDTVKKLFVATRAIAPTMAAGFAVEHHYTPPPPTARSNEVCDAAITAAVPSPRDEPSSILPPILGHHLRLQPVATQEQLSAQWWLDIEIPDEDALVKVLVSEQCLVVDAVHAACRLCRLPSSRVAELAIALLRSDSVQTKERAEADGPISIESIPLSLLTASDKSSTCVKERWQRLFVRLSHSLRSPKADGGSPASAFIVSDLLLPPQIKTA